MFVLKISKFDIMAGKKSFFLTKNNYMLIKQDFGNPHSNFNISFSFSLKICDLCGSFELLHNDLIFLHYWDVFYCCCKNSRAKKVLGRI